MNNNGGNNGGGLLTIVLGVFLALLLFSLF